MSGTNLKMKAAKGVPSGGEFVEQGENGMRSGWFVSMNPGTDENPWSPAFDLARKG
jgi:hypothetical protein